MRDLPLKQATGRLDPDQVANGINAAHRNAMRLLEDADILFKNERWASVAAISILSIEEFHKTYILRAISAEVNNAALLRQWKNYRSHTKKNLLAHLPELIRNGARTPEKLQQLFDPKAKHPHQIEQIKQWATYTDCYGSSAWLEPAMFVDQPLAEYLLKTAKLIVSNHVVTKREIELWIEHVGPGSASPKIKAEAIATWFDAMKTEGILKDEEMDISHFIWPYAYE